MNAQLQTIQQPQQNIPRWNLALRIAFRFSMVYLGLYCLATQVLSVLLRIPTADRASLPDLATVWPLRPVISWAAAHIFHVSAPLSFGGGSGSYDDTFGWVTAFCLLMIATVATVVF